MILHIFVRPVSTVDISMMLVSRREDAPHDRGGIGLREMTLHNQGSNISRTLHVVATVLRTCKRAAKYESAVIKLMSAKLTSALLAHKAAVCPWSNATRRPWTKEKNVKSAWKEMQDFMMPSPQLKTSTSHASLGICLTRWEIYVSKHQLAIFKYLEFLFGIICRRTLRTVTDVDCSSLWTQLTAKFVVDSRVWVWCRKRPMLLRRPTAGALEMVIARLIACMLMARMLSTTQKKLLHVKLDISSDGWVKPLNRVLLLHARQSAVSSTTTFTFPEAITSIGICNQDWALRFV